MNSNDDYQIYALVKQSKVRKLPTYASSTSSSSSSSSYGSSANNSPNGSGRDKHSVHPNFDTDEGYASFTTTSTAFPSHRSNNNVNRDDSTYYTSTSERLPTSLSSSRALLETDSDKSDLSDGENYSNDNDDNLVDDLVDWPSLNQQVQTLVTRLDKWLHRPLPDRSIPIQSSPVDHAYPILQRRTSSVPLAINLGTDQSNDLPYQSDYVLNFVQNNDANSGEKPKLLLRTVPSSPDRLTLKSTQPLEHCHNCSRLIQLLSSSSRQQRSIVQCPYCDLCYCSKTCQKSDWPVHKRNCILSNSYSCCGYILRLMKSNEFLLRRLSTLASSGYLSSGRGAALLYFDSMNEADAYVQSTQIENTRLMAIYWSLNDRKTNRAIDHLRSSEYEHLQELTMIYDPTTEFVCHVTIRVEGNLDNTYAQYVSRTMIFKLSEMVSSSPTTASTYPTLYFSSINYNTDEENSSHMRQVFFAKLQTELRERGIEIEEHYPELYHKLCDYLSPNQSKENKLFPFTPICLFMRHRYAQQLFMCVITPESEPDRSWLLDRCRVEKNLVMSNENNTRKESSCEGRSFFVTTADHVLSP